jgi:AcrR family transcriptional regulator
MTTPTPGVRGTYAKTEQFRAEVLEAALGLVADQGFDAATLQTIADEVGRSKAGLLHHFGSRERLMLEIARHRDETNRAEFPPDADGGFDASVALVAHNATVPGLIALFTVVSALAAADTDESERRAYFVRRYRRTRKGFARRIAEGQAAGTIRADLSPEAAATLILATMDGLQTQWLLDDSIDMAAHLQTLVRLLQTDPAASGRD